MFVHSLLLGFSNTQPLYTLVALSLLLVVLTDSSFSLTWTRIQALPVCPKGTPRALWGAVLASPLCPPPPPPAHLLHLHLGLYCCITVSFCLSYVLPFPLLTLSPSSANLLLPLLPSLAFFNTLFVSDLIVRLSAWCQKEMLPIGSVRETPCG